MELCRLCFFIAALGLLSTRATAATEQCERLLEPGDVLIDVRDSNVTVLISNLRDNCTVIFADWLRTGPGQAKAWPVVGGLGLWVESLDGKVLSEPHGEPYFYYAFEDSVGNTGVEADYTLTRMAAGEIRLKRWTIDRMMQALDYWRSVYKQRPLPWGTKVVMRVKVTIAVDTKRAAGDYAEEERAIQIVTPRFVYELPTTPVK